MHHQFLKKLLPLTIGISLILGGCGLPGADKDTTGKDTAENATSMASTVPSDASSDMNADQASAAPEASEAVAAGDEIVPIQYIRE